MDKFTFGNITELTKWGKNSIKHLKTMNNTKAVSLIFSTFKLYFYVINLNISNTFCVFCNIMNRNKESKSDVF